MEIPTYAVRVMRWMRTAVVIGAVTISLLSVHNASASFYLGRSGTLGGSSSAHSEIVTFPSGGLTLHGVVYKPGGEGRFPAVLYNHGSAPGMLSSQAFAALGPVFAQHGWVFFGPYRRGQGLSADAGPYIGDQIDAARKKGGIREAAATAVRVLQTSHLDDQLAGLAWLRKQPFVRPGHIAVMGTSFGGVETVLGAEHASYCAAIDVSGGAESWDLAPELRSVMENAVRNAQVPIFFFQPQNDYNLAPSNTLAAAMKSVGKVFEVKIYPSYGKSVGEAHSFGYFGSTVWGEDVFRFLHEHCGSPNG
jgi:carboxymethylenebutenolidase